MGYSPESYNELDTTEATWPEKAMAPHSSTLAWRIPGTGEPGGYLLFVVVLVPGNLMAVISEFVCLNRISKRRVNES